MYRGLEHEQAPKDLTEAFVKNGIKIIGERAFAECDFLVKVNIPDSVTRIENSAFFACGSDDSDQLDSASLQFIELPPKLQLVG